MDLNATLTEVSQARLVARAWAQRNGRNDDRCEALAEIWLDAGKDVDACTGRDLEQYLSRRFES